MTRQGLTLDAWSEVVEHVGTDDLLSLCLVSRVCKAVATRVLYRSIILKPGLYWPVETPIEQSQLSPSEQRGHWHLLSRLKSKEHQRLRNLVQEVTLLRPSSALVSLNEAFVNHLRQDDYFSKLLTSLPNLRHVTTDIPELQTDNVVRALCAHSNRPELHLKMHGYKERLLSTDSSPLRCISSLQVAGDPRSYPKDNGLLKFQNLVFSCPNIRSLSITVLDEYNGRMRRPRLAGIYLTFSLEGDEEFPPLEDLTLDGYVMKDGEASVWQDNVQWDKLASLTVGPSPCWSVLPRFAGYATSLKTLRVFTYHGVIGGDEARIGLETLLGSFDGLEVLEVKRVICSVSAVGQHRGLSTLCLHEDEPQHDGETDERRTVLPAADILYLDRQCPRMSSLGLDIQRGNGKLNEKALEAVVTGFKNLRHLSIRFEIGLKDIRQPITPVINAETAQSIGQDIFDRRKEAGYSLPTLTLWTGSSYRNRIDWEPKYVKFESRFTARYTLRQGEGLTEKVEGVAPRLSSDDENEEDEDGDSQYS